MKILCSGDIHLGRQPTRLGPRLEGRAASPAAVWEAMVAQAIEQRVELLLLSGDVVDRENRFYEAVGPLERGLVRLGEAGIRVAAVAGNHDFDVLSRVVQTVGQDRLTLLGTGGRWERARFELSGGPVHVDGWSFASQHVRQSPLASYTLEPARDGVTLVLVHGDLDQPASDYAPLDSAELRRLPVAGCVLGHIHKPMVDHEPGRAAVLYPGSPQPLDPGETGPHGAVLLTVEAGGAGGAVNAVEWLPLATVRYEAVEVDLGGVADAAEADQRLFEQLRRTAQAAAEQGGGHLAEVRCRVTLTGRTRAHRLLPRQLDAAVDELEATHEGVTASVEKIRYATRPAVELESLARGEDAAAVLARALLGLEDQGAADRELRQAMERLIGDAQRAVGQVRQAGVYRDLADSGAAIEADQAKRLLHEQGLLLLDELLSQKEAAGEGVAGE